MTRRYGLTAEQMSRARSMRSVRSLKGNPTRPVGDPESAAADRWLCRRSPVCRHTPCGLSIQRARLSRIRAAYGRRHR